VYAQIRFLLALNVGFAPEATEMRIDGMCRQATSPPFIRSPCQRSQAILTEILGRMSWRSCLEGLASRCRSSCLGLSFICNDGGADDEDDFGANPKYPNHEIHA